MLIVNAQATPSVYKLAYNFSLMFSIRSSVFFFFLFFSLVLKSRCRIGSASGCGATGSQLCTILRFLTFLHTPVCVRWIVNASCFFFFLHGAPIHGMYTRSGGLVSSRLCPCEHDVHYPKPGMHALADVGERSGYAHTSRQENKNKRCRQPIVAVLRLLDCFTLSYAPIRSLLFRIACLQFRTQMCHWRCDRNKHPVTCFPLLVFYFYFFAKNWKIEKLKNRHNVHKSTCN